MDGLFRFAAVADEVMDTIAPSFRNEVHIVKDVSVVVSTTEAHNELFSITTPSRHSLRD